MSNNDTSSADDAAETTSSEKLVHELAVAAGASIGVIAIRCPETEVYRVVDDLFAMSMQNRVEFRLHTTERGWQTFERIDMDDHRAPAFDPLEPQTDDRGTIAIPKAFEALYSGALPNAGYFVMLDLYFTFDSMQTQTAIRKQVQRSISNDQRLFLIVPNFAEIPEAIAPLMHVIEFDYPTRTELGESLDDILDSLDDSDKPDLDEDQRVEILSHGQGMTANAFETASALSITEYGQKHGTMEGFSYEHIVTSIRNYKMQILQKTAVLELQPHVEENEIGGLDLFKQWMHERRATYTDDAKAHKVTPSRGAMVVGPPGTGKSLVAKAAGSILNLPVIRFDVGRVFGQYVGQSEHAMRTVLKLLEAMTPCVLMLDEIDKGFSGVSGSSNDSGTTQRVFGTFLTWMQERNQIDRPVFLIMTANRIQGLPPELTRRGRIDEIWSVNMPNEVEREAIIRIHAEKRQQSIATSDMKSIVRITNGLVGAEIESVIEDALVMALAAEEPGLTYEFVERAKGFLKPMSVTRAEEFDAMKTWADTHARPASSSVELKELPNKGVRRRGTGRRPRPRAKVRRDEEDQR